MRLAETIQQVVGETTPIEITAYDGSRAGAVGAPVCLALRSPLALAHFASAPGELGLVRAYVSGHLDVRGDLYTALASIPTPTVSDVSPALRGRIAARLLAARLWWPVSRPPQEARMRGRVHSKGRDAGAISHHYDVSNRFYELVLGPSMAYSCAVYPSETATLESAQFEKFDLICRKLGLREGMRLLDVGCGWGGMVMHAAKHYGARAIGVTLSTQQAEWARKAVAREELGDRVEIRRCDYRDVPESGFDAVSSIGVSEHIGAAELSPYFQILHDKLAPGGRMLNACITRPMSTMPARTGPFIDRYVFPDGELESAGEVVTRMHDTGFEVRHCEDLREHYAKTLAAWCANLDADWAAVTTQVSEATARVWRLYMAASRLAFEHNNLQLHHVLGVRPDGTDARVPLRPDWS